MHAQARSHCGRSEKCHEADMAIADNIGRE
jgi:hypothetical protein